MASLKTTVVGRPAAPGPEEALRVNLESREAEHGPTLHHMILGVDGLEVHLVNRANPAADGRAQVDGLEAPPVNLASQAPLLVDGPELDGGAIRANLERVNQVKAVGGGLMRGAQVNRASLAVEKDLEDGTVGESLQENQASLVAEEARGGILLLIHGATVEDGMAGGAENLVNPNLVNPNLRRENGCGCLQLQNPSQLSNQP